MKTIWMVAAMVLLMAGLGCNDNKYDKDGETQRYRKKYADSGELKLPTETLATRNG